MQRTWRRRTRADAGMAPEVAKRIAPGGGRRATSNKTSAVFSTPVNVSYFFERVQLLRIVVYDHDGKSSDVSQYDTVGWTELKLGDIVGGGGASTVRELAAGHGQHRVGRLRARAQELRTGPNYNVTYAADADRGGARRPGVARDHAQASAVNVGAAVGPCAGSDSRATTWTKKVRPPSRRALRAAPFRTLTSGPGHGGCGPCHRHVWEIG